MVRKILGYALLALVALFVLKIALALLGTLLGLAVTLMVLSVMGYGFYLLIRVVSPASAARLREFLTGQGNRPASPTA